MIRKGILYCIPLHTGTTLFIGLTRISVMVNLININNRHSILLHSRIKQIRNNIQKCGE